MVEVLNLYSAIATGLVPLSNFDYLALKIVTILPT